MRNSAEEKYAMGTRVELAVVGESMSGKSSWIASLFTEEITGKLAGVFQKNREGQTKIRVCYDILSGRGIDLRTENIGWNRDCLQDIDSRNTCCATLEGLKEILDISLEGVEDISRFVEGEDFQKAVQKADPVELLEKIVNNAKVLEEGLISYIDFAGSGNEDVRRLLEGYGLESIRIRDTRGFLDETPEQWKELLEKLYQPSKVADGVKNPEYDEGDREAQCIQKLLDNGGVHGIDACVFMTISGSVALQKKSVKEIYSPLIQSLLEKYPVFLVGRNEELTKRMAEGNESYRNCCAGILSEPRFTGFDDIRNLLDELRERTRNSQGEDYRTAIAQKHYRELLVSAISQKMWKEDEWIFRKSAVGALGEILEGVTKYHKDIDEADRCMKEIRKEHGDAAENIYDKLFIDNLWVYTDGCAYNRMYRFGMEFLAKKVQGKYRSDKNDTNGLVGERGGLSTPIPGGGYVGEAAIDLLEAAYRMRENIYSELVEELTPAIRKYIESISREPGDVERAVLEMKQKLTEYYRHKMDHNFECLSITKRMIPRKFLEAAYEATRNDLEVSAARIGKYLKKLENRFAENDPARKLWYTSVVMYITWKLIAISGSVS